MQATKHTIKGSLESASTHPSLGECLEELGPKLRGHMVLVRQGDLGAYTWQEVLVKTYNRKTKQHS